MNAFSADEADIAVEVLCPRWLEFLPEVEGHCREVALRTLADAGQPFIGERPVEVSIVLADDETQRRFNREWRGKDSSTNVLSFASFDDGGIGQAPGQPLLLGDVILAFETCQSEAADQGKSLADHLAHLVAHGILHLLGHDHEDDDEAEVMEALETRVLAALGIADPYGLEEEAATSPKEGDATNERS